MTIHPGIVRLWFNLRHTAEGKVIAGTSRWRAVATAE
jgi:hypothetical protein